VYVPAIRQKKTTNGEELVAISSLP
jgi:pre-mRNA-splicing helicase BRR2